MRTVLYFCQIIDDRWNENYENIKNIYDYVDHIILIDGAKTNDSYNNLNNLYGNDIIKLNGDVCNEQLKHQGYYFHKETISDIRTKKIIYIEFPWRDDFIESRNQYIYAVESLRRNDDNSWFIISDEDEFLSKRLVRKLKKLCDWANEKNLLMLKVRCRSVETDDNGKRIHENIDNYWKELIFKYTDGLRIRGVKVHHGFNRGYIPKIEVINLPDNVSKGKELEILYEHRKSGIKVIWERAHTRNWFIYASNFAEENKLWKPFRKLVDECMIDDGFGKPLTWHDYRDYLRRGNVNEKLKRWFIRYAMEGVKDRDFDLWPESDAEKYFRSYPHPETGKICDIEYNGSSECREGFLLYFGVLHKNELLKLDNDIVLKSNLNKDIKNWYINNKCD